MLSPLTWPLSWRGGDIERKGIGGRGIEKGNGIEMVTEERQRRGVEEIRKEKIRKGTEFYQLGPFAS